MRMFCEELPEPSIYYIYPITRYLLINIPNCLFHDISSANVAYLSLIEVLLRFSASVVHFWHKDSWFWPTFSFSTRSSHNSQTNSSVVRIGIVLTYWAQSFKALWHKIIKILIFQPLWMLYNAGDDWLRIFLLRDKSCCTDSFREKYQTRELTVDGLTNKFHQILHCPVLSARGCIILQGICCRL